MAEGDAAPTSDRDRLAQFMAEGDAPPEPATPSIGGFLSGAADFVAHTLAGNPLSAWQGLSPSQKESVKEYGPAAAITAGSMLIPGGPAIQAGVNLAANSAIHGVDAYTHNRDVLSEMNPVNHPLETGIGLVAPYAFDLGRSFYRGLKGGSGLAQRLFDQNAADAVTEATEGTARAADALIGAGDAAVPALPEQGLGPVGGAADAAGEFAGKAAARPPSFMSAMRLDAPLPRLPELPKPPVSAEVVDDLVPGAFPQLNGPGVGAATDVPATITQDLPTFRGVAADEPSGPKAFLQNYIDSVRDRMDVIKKGIESARINASLPERYLLKRPGEAEQVAGKFMYGRMASEHRLAENSRSMLNWIHKDLTPAERVEVTRILEGKLAPEAASRPEVARAAAAQREFYDQWFTVGEREGLPTLNPETGEVYPFQKQPDYSPRIKADLTARQRIRRLRDVYRKDTLAHARLGDPLDESEYLTDAYEIGLKYADDMAKKVAIARTFGAATGDRTLAQPLWGKRANQIYSLLQQGDDPIAAPMFKGAMDRLYTGQSGEADEGMRALNAIITASRLGASWATQIGQAANPLWRWGFRNTAEGIGRYISDPASRALTDASGVRNAGFANFLTADGNADRAALPIRAIGYMERKLRGPLNSGVIPYVEKLAERVNAGETSAALEKQLAELMLSRDQLADGLTWDTLKDAIQAGGHRAQFHADGVGQVGNVFLDTVPKIATSLQPFGWKAWAAAQDDILEPMLSRDASLRRLGAERFAKMLVAAAAAETARNIPASLVRLREPDPREAAANLLGTQFGTVGQVVGGKLLGQAVDPRFNFQSPFWSVPVQMYSDLSDGRLGSFGLDLATLLDPSGVVAMARPTLSGLNRQLESKPKRHLR